MSLFGEADLLLSGGQSGEQNFFQILTDLSMIADLKLCLDAGSLASYDGTDGGWQDLTANAYQLFLGIDDTVEAADPEFMGVAGDLSGAEFFECDGSEYFTFDEAGGMPSWISDMHKVGAQWSLLIWAKLKTSGTNDYLVNTMSSSSTNGFRLDTTGRDLSLFVHGALTVSNTTANVYDDDTWNLVGANIDAVGSTTSFYFLNGQYAPVADADLYDADFTGAGSSDADTLMLGARPGGGTVVPAGYGYAGAAFFDGLLTIGQMQDFWNATRARFGLYNGTWAGTAGAAKQCEDSLIPGFRFIATKTGYISGVTFNLTAEHTSNTIQARIYADGSNTPNVTDHAASSNTVGTSIAPGDADFTFADNSADPVAGGNYVTQGTAYWVVLCKTNGAIDSTGWSMATVTEIYGNESGRASTITGIPMDALGTTLHWKCKLKYNGEA